MRPFTLTPRDALRLLYMVFFKPISLDRYIHQVDPTLGRNPGLRTMRVSSNKYPEFVPLLQLCWFHILLTPWMLAFLIAVGFAWIGFSIDLPRILLGTLSVVAAGIAFGIVGGITFGVALSVASGIACGFAGGFAGALGVTTTMTPTLELALVVALFFGAAWGIASGVSIHTVWNVIGGILWGVALGIGWGMMWGMAWGIGIDFGIVFSLTFSASYILAYFRIPLFVLYTSFIWLMLRLNNMAWQYSPILWDELIWFPLPNLDEQLVILGKAEIDIRKKGEPPNLQPIFLVGASFRQSWAAKKAFGELTLYIAQNSTSDLDDIVIATSTLIMPIFRLLQNNRSDVESFLVNIEQLGHYAKATLESDTLYNRQQQLRLGLKAIQKMRQGLSFYTDRRFAQQAGPVLQNWEQIFQRELNAANQKEQIPNVYVAGSPLAEQSKVFKGRRDVFRALERELTGEASQRPAILLFGARRSGKSSALKQLPVMLGPQVVPVTVDLQSLALTNDAAGFLGKMAAEIKSAALISRRFDLPDLPPKDLQADPYAAFADWLKHVDAALETRWMLLCLDEYEYLEKMLADSRLDERIFQLLRAMLQNYPRLTLLFSGAHTFEELNPRWSHHLINVRLLKIGHLAAPDARELVVEPIPTFPLRYAAGAAEQILETIGGQPYLLQATCRDLVNLLNEFDRPDASTDDVALALESTLTSASAYFNELWTGPDSTDAQRAILTALAQPHDQPVSLEALRQLGTPRDIQTLVEHDVVEKNDAGYHIKVALVRRWIERKL